MFFLYYILKQIFSRVSQTFVLFIILSTIITIQVWRSNAIFEFVRELGHHYTSVGNILDMTSAANRKQERQARLWAYNKQIGLIGLVRAFEHGCQNRFEIAEYLEVTEEFLEECIECYRNKYGICKRVDNYVVYFIPQLSVMKLV